MTPGLVPASDPMSPRRATTRAGAAADTRGVQSLPFGRFSPMSYSQIVNPTTTDRDGLRRSLKPLAAAVYSISAVWTVLGAHDMTEIVVVLVVAAAVTVGIYGFLMPKALDKPSAGSTALTLSLVATALILPG